MYDIIELNGKLVSDLREIAKSLNIPKADKLLKQDIIYKILDHQALNPTEEVLEKEKKESKKAPYKGKRSRISRDPEKVEAKKAPIAKEDSKVKAQAKEEPKALSRTLFK